MDEHQETPAPRPCPTCGKDGHIDLTREYETTCVGGYPHNPNCLSGRFECPDQHLFWATTQMNCSCGHTGVKDCHISGHHKITPIPPTTPVGTN